MRFENRRVLDAACRIGPLDEHRAESAQRRAEQRRSGQFTHGGIAESRRQHRGEQDRIDITRVVGNDKHRTRVRQGIGRAFGQVFEPFDANLNTDKASAQRAHARAARRRNATPGSNIVVSQAPAAATTNTAQAQHAQATWTTPHALRPACAAAARATSLVSCHHGARCVRPSARCSYSSRAWRGESCRSKSSAPSAVAQARCRRAACRSARPRVA